MRNTSGSGFSPTHALTARWWAEFLAPRIWAARPPCAGSRCSARSTQARLQLSSRGLLAAPTGSVARKTRPVGGSFGDTQTLTYASRSGPATARDSGWRPAARNPSACSRGRAAHQKPPQPSAASGRSPSSQGDQSRGNPAGRRVSRPTPGGSRRWAARRRDGTDRGPAARTRASQDTDHGARERGTPPSAEMRGPRGCVHATAPRSPRPG